MQTFVASPFFRDIEPSPIEALSSNLTAALLSLGINHSSLQKTISGKLWAYLDNCVAAAESIASSTQRQTSERGISSEVEDAIRIATITISMLGFLDAAATYANFWSAAERRSLVERFQRILSESFLVTVETAFSTLRNTHSHQSNIKEWKRCAHHYAAIGRPLGAMLLQRGFMWLLVAASSLLVADISKLRGNDILDLLMSGSKILRTSEDGIDFATIEAMADIAADEMSLLEDGADYLRLGSAWQQRLAFSVKAAALISYLNCALLNEDAAEPDILMSWLENTLADPVQMADETLAKVVLRSMALISKLSPAYATTVTKILPRFIVHGGTTSQTIKVASSCLAYVLQLLSQDAIISTLYTLGNVLSRESNSERGHTSHSSVNGDSPADRSSGSTFYAGKQSTGSATSLTITGEEDATAVYGNVIQAICSIAISCKDPKITALAQSMLAQKITKNKTVEARIITEAAALSLSGGTSEFRSLLRVYLKLTHDAVVNNDEVILGAVSANHACNAYLLT